MGLQIRKRINVIPGFVYATASKSGISWTFKLGPLSWNTRRGRARLDLPGPASYEFDKPGD